MIWIDTKWLATKRNNMYLGNTVLFTRLIHERMETFPLA